MFSLQSVIVIWPIRTIQYVIQEMVSVNVSKVLQEDFMEGDNVQNVAGML